MNLVLWQLNGYEFQLNFLLLNIINDLRVDARSTTRLRVIGFRVKYEL